MAASVRLVPAVVGLLLVALTMSACDALVVAPKGRGGKACGTPPAADTTSSTTPTAT
ncbi:hypothetical protein [Hymenobacter sp. BT730]|uniref:hypothetical protein n=1 Tax=Hymenobacter sp. BT730 TaxID=3063332 RepID=UPI0026DF0D07|nr:hypothetical protein [Hymenobacter sp. BT730]